MSDKNRPGGGVAGEARIEVSHRSGWRHRIPHGGELRRSRRGHLHQRHRIIPAQEPQSRRGENEESCCGSMPLRSSRAVNSPGLNQMDSPGKVPCASSRYRCLNVNFRTSLIRLCANLSEARGKAIANRQCSSPPTTSQEVQCTRSIVSQLHPQIVPG
jgi:hypothetical protein